MVKEEPEIFFWPRVAFDEYRDLVSSPFVWTHSFSHPFVGSLVLHFCTPAVCWTLWKALGKRVNVRDPCPGGPCNLMGGRSAIAGAIEKPNDPIRD